MTRNHRKSSRPEPSTLPSGGGFRSIVEHATDIIARFDREGRHLYVNPAAERVTGRTAATFIGRTNRDLGMPDELTDFWRDKLQQVFETGQGQEIEFDFPGVRGEGRTFRSRLVPEWGADGRVETVLAIARDVTGRRRMEERLRVSEERFRLLVEGSRQVFFYIHDPDHRFEYISPSVRTVLGYTPEELVGQRYDILLTGDPSNRTVHERTAAKLSGNTHVPGSTYTARVRHRNGAEVILELVERPVLRNGRIVGLHGFARDVTERVRAMNRERFLSDTSKALASSLDYQETLRTVARLAVPVLADWCVVDVVEEDGVHRLAAQHSDPTRQELTGRLLDFPPDMARDRGVPMVLRTGESLHLEGEEEQLLREAAQDDTHRRILEALGLDSVIIVPLRARGSTLGALSFVASDSGRHYRKTDVRFAEEIAGRAALALDNARLHRQAHEAIAIRDEVLGFVSHDLKNPLNIIVNAAELLGAQTDKFHTHSKYVRMILRAAAQMRTLIEDLLAAARMEAGRLWVNQTPCDPRRILEEVVDLLEPMARRNGLRIETRVSPGLPPVHADPRRLIQVFQNLVGNAIDKTPEGGRVTLEATSADEEVRFAVSDTGPGIPPEHLEHLFDRFWQADHSRSAGAGLGLAITKGIVEAHGGRIVAESTVGEGTTFRFTVPVSDTRTAENREAR